MGLSVPYYRATKEKVQVAVSRSGVGGCIDKPLRGSGEGRHRSHATSRGVDRGDQAGDAVGGVELAHVVQLSGSSADLFQ
jgi:hypothetical protein